MHALMFCLLVLAGTPLFSQSPADVDAYLAALNMESPDYLVRFRRVVEDSAGTPYKDGPLGEGPGAPYDSDPLMDLSCVDCVTFVEQSVALAGSVSDKDAMAKLQQVRYAGGKVDFATRNHFMIADWVPNNPWCSEVTARLGIPVAQVTRTISKADFFRKVKAPDLGQDVPDRDVTLTYIPIDLAGDVTRQLKHPALIVFVGHIDWLFALHCGIYLPNGSEPGGFYHASSKAGKVVRMDLGEYARDQAKRYLGVAVYEITPPVFLDKTP